MRLDPVDISLVQVCPRTGRSLHSLALKQTAISYCLSETDCASAQASRILVIGREEKSQREYPVAGGVKVIARLAATEGKATLMLVKRNLQVMLRTDPEGSSRT